MILLAIVLTTRVLCPSAYRGGRIRPGDGWSTLYLEAEASDARYKLQRGYALDLL
jgi:hypothetical protein